MERKRTLQKLMFAIGNFILRNQKNSGGQYLPELYEKVKYDNYVSLPTVPVKPHANVPESLTMMGVPEKGKFVEEEVDTSNKLIDNTLVSPRNSVRLSTQIYREPTNHYNNYEQQNLNHEALSNVSSILNEIDEEQFESEENDVDIYQQRKPPPLPSFDLPPPPPPSKNKSTLRDIPSNRNSSANPPPPPPPISSNRVSPRDTRPVKTIPPPPNFKPNTSNTSNPSKPNLPPPTLPKVTSKNPGLGKNNLS